MSVPVILMWSGGKDATLALDRLQQGDRYRPAMLLTTVTQPGNTVSMHGVPLALIEAQADSVGCPLLVMCIPEGASNEVYEAELARTLRHSDAAEVTMVAVGDLYLEDVRAYREDVLRRLGKQPLFPLWEEDTGLLAHHFIHRGYRAVVTSVDTEQLDPSFVGRRYDEAFLQELPEEVDPCGEGGEFHTFVYDGPAFSEPVDVVVGAQYGKGRMRYVRVSSSRS